MASLGLWLQTTGFLSHSLYNTSGNYVLSFRVSQLSSSIPCFATSKSSKYLERKKSMFWQRPFPLTGLYFLSTMRLCFAFCPLPKKKEVQPHILKPSWKELVRRVGLIILNYSLCFFKNNSDLTKLILKNAIFCVPDCIW